MTERTRWDALAEELSDKQPEEKKPQPTLVSGVELMAGDKLSTPASRLESRVPTTFLVIVDGLMIPATDIQLSWTRNVDLELVRLGTLSDEIIADARPETVTGSFTTTSKNLKLSGKELQVIVTRGDETLQFMMHATCTEWRSDGPMTVKVIGTQVA